MTMLTSWKLDPHTVVRLKSGRTGDDVLKGGHSLREISNLVEFTGPRYSHGT